MGWGHCGTDDTGRPIGYMILATCDEPDCSVVIDRGLSYVCGNMHGGAECGCGRYFCTRHLTIARTPAGGLVQLCRECLERMDREYPEREE